MSFLPKYFDVYGMMWSLFLSVYAVIGIYPCVANSALIQVQDDSQFRYTGFSHIFDRSKYAFLSFATQRTRVARDIGRVIPLPLMQDAMKTTCENNKELQESSKRLTTCLNSKRILVTPKDEFIEHLRSCSSETKQLLTQCLPSKLRYFSDFVFALAESVSKLLYDDSKEISKLSFCIPEMKSSKSEQFYNDCATHGRGTINDKIPGSKKIFCEKFITVSECFVKQINKTCTIDSDIEKFTQDYMRAMKEPCLNELE